MSALEAMVLAGKGLNITMIFLLIIGTGKTKLIADISSTIDYIIRRYQPGSLERPLVVRTAFTGVAACNIDGMTLHTCLSLPFGNQFYSLPDEKRDDMRNKLSDLRFFIIDEISMVKPDLLYQVKKKL
jgi:hypothetical protein